MNFKQLFTKSPYLVLVAGLAIGAVGTVTLLSPGVLPVAKADPDNAKLRTIGSISSTDMATLRSLNASFEGLAEYVGPSVVHIKADSGKSTDMLGREMVMGGQGSGVIYRSDGYIVTNDHVVGGFDNVTVILNDGREFRGKVTRSDDAGDIAVVKIDAKDLKAARFADSATVKPGQFAIAVGSPFGLENSVTIGHVSGLQRQSSVADMRLGSARNYFDLIQTDAAINMGNSGGPLLNIDGEVIGINTAIYSETGGNTGIGMAIPSNQTRLIAEMLIERGKVTRSFMGVIPENLKPYQKSEMNLNGGAVLVRVENDSPAGKSGLKKDDVVVRIGDYPISNQIDLRNAMLRYEPGSTVKVEYVRQGKRSTVEVKLETPPVTPKFGSNERPSGPFDGRQLPFDLKDVDPKLKEFFDSQGKSFDDSPRTPRTGKARLGTTVETVTDSLRKQFSIPKGVEGAVVTSVDPGSVAERLGLKAGDVIQQLGDTQIKSAESLAKAVDGLKWGDTRTLKTTRYSKNGVATTIRDVTFN